jgi:hypothetical protein
MHGAGVAVIVGRLEAERDRLEKQLALEREANAALRERVAALEAAPPGVYSCGCPARWAERRIDGFCATHYRPLKTAEGDRC